MNNLFKSLRLLKKIEPEVDFITHSREVVLGSSKRPLYRSLLRQQFNQVLALGLTMSLAVVLIVAMGNISRLKLNGFSPDILANLNNKELNREKENIDFQIHLAEANYYKESTQEITMAIGNVFSLDSSTLDSERIKKQADGLDLLIKRLTL